MLRQNTAFINTGEPPACYALVTIVADIDDGLGMFRSRYLATGCEDESFGVILTGIIRRSIRGRRISAAQSFPRNAQLVDRPRGEGKRTAQRLQGAI